MGVHDQGARIAVTAEPGFVFVRLRPVTGLVLSFRSWFPTRGLPLPGGPNRDPDLVALADDQDGKAWLLIFEVQSQHDPKKPNVAQLEAMVFLNHASDPDRDGGELLPLPVFVYLRGKCPEGGVVSAQTPTGCGYRGKPGLWEVAEDPASLALAKVESNEYPWGALFWVSLMAGADTDELIRLRVRLRDEKVPVKHRADVTGGVLIFADLAGCRLAWNRVLQGVDMTVSAFANELIEMGKLDSKREDLILVIRLRFPAILTPEVEQAIANQPSLPVMKAWHGAACDPATTAESFLAVLRR